jgi:hypothetical protein
MANGERAAYPGLTIDWVIGYGRLMSDRLYWVIGYGRLMSDRLVYGWLMLTKADYY